MKKFIGWASSAFLKAKLGVKLFSIAVTICIAGVALSFIMDLLNTANTVLNILGFGLMIAFVGVIIAILLDIARKIEI